MLLRILLLALPSLQGHAAGPGETAGPRRDLSALLEEVRGRFDVPALAGMTITVDGPVAAGWCGVRARGSEVPVAPADRFHLGSCTKAMTATLVALLAEEERLARDVTLAEVWPELAPDMDEPWRAVTLDQLLSHTAGAPENLFGYGMLGLRMVAGEAPLTALRRELVAGVTEAPPLFTPGTRQRYSNMGYVIAGALCEERAGRPWEELMRERLFEPLGMRSAGFGAPDALAAPDAPDAPGGSGEPVPHGGDGEPLPGFDNPPFLGPAGTVHASLEDWASFVGLHLRGARGEEGLLLPPEAFRWLHEPRPGTGGSYAAGWLVLERPWSKGRVLAHNGSNTAWFAWTWIAPEEGFAVLVCCNQGGDAGEQATDAAAWALIREHLREAEPSAAGER